jgi:thiamine phosphate synthase YjbQ (UPF0047 family)
LKIISSFIELETCEGIALQDLMPDIRNSVAKSGIRNGFVTVTSQHTTTAIAINENEERLVEDVEVFLTALSHPMSRRMRTLILPRCCREVLKSLHW